MFVAGLYSTFIFKKSTRVVRPASYFDFQLDTEFQFDRDLEPVRTSPKSDASPEMPIGYELTPETTPRDSSPRIKKSVFSLPSGAEELISSQEELYLFDTARPKEESSVYTTVQDAASSPTGRINIESHPQQQVTDTPNNSDQFFPFAPVDLLSDPQHQLHFQEFLDHFAENKSCHLEERDRSARTPPDEDPKGVPEQFLEKQEQNEETMVVVQAGEECDGHLEDEIMPNEEKVSTMQEEIVIAASSQRTAPGRKDRSKRKKKRTARFCHTVISTPIDPEVTGQITCSVNYQSEVEQEVVDPEHENISVPAPPPFLFYQRKKRTEKAGPVVQEAGFSTNVAGSTVRALRPRRSSSVGDPKVAPGNQS